MNDNVTDLLAALRVFGSIELGQRINTSGAKFSVVYPSTINSLYRWWTGESRDQNIEMIRKFLTRVFNMIDKQLQDPQKNAILLARLLASLEFAGQGLSKLKFTYKTDKHVSSTLEVLLENIGLYKSKMIVKISPHMEKQTLLLE